MKKSIYFLLALLVSLNFSCSSDDSIGNEQPEETSLYKITFGGVLDKNHSANYPVSTNNTIQVIYVADGNTETITYTSLENEVTIEKSKELEARNTVGLKISSVTEDTFLTYITVKIEKMETGEVVFIGDMETVVYDSPDEYSSLEISVLYDIANDTATVTD